jgi:hypothetical protein
MSTSGLLLCLFGVLVVAQVVEGDALSRLGIFGGGS